MDQHVKPNPELGIQSQEPHIQETEFLVKFTIRSRF